MANLFISYSSRDRELAGKLASELRASGHRIAIDVDSLVPGVEWRRELMEKLFVSDGVVVLLTEHSVGSPFVFVEIGAARASRNQFLIPVIVGDLPVHPVVQDIYAVAIPSGDGRNLKRAVHKINDAVKAHRKRFLTMLGFDPPSGYEHLSSQVHRFCDESPFEHNVFVMMKFPDKGNMLVRHVRLLSDIWEIIDSEVRRHGLEARRADERSYHDQLWENVCVYLIGSKYGIAVLEDEVASEMNPNIALEYGFMRALNRPVALLRNRGFKHSRADLSGKLAKTFDIVGGELKEDTLRKAVGDWLKEQGLSRRRANR
jgi:hypothetical protein